ncbi:hypothetical protein NECID01_1608 [Nematocida sp. AWRm77]|nr:hypothetical protein NECID01_1608 [Nematocida sp. AWRm77]
MIIKTCALTKGKECLVPKKYVPVKEIFENYADFYHQESDKLFEQIKQLTEDAEEFEELPSEEKEDDEIRKTDMMLCALNAEPLDPKVEVYVYEEDTEGLYVHHDIFLHTIPTSMAVLDREEDPLVFVSHETREITGYNLFVKNHFCPDLVIKDAHSSPITEIEADSAVLVSTDGTSLKGWDVATQKNMFVEEQTSVARLGLLQGMAVYSTENTLYLKDPRAKEAQKLFATDSPITALSTDKEAVALGCVSGEIYLWESGKVLKSFAHRERVNSVSFSISKHIVSAAEDEFIMLTNMEIPETVYKKKTSMDHVTASVPLDNRMLCAFPTNDEEVNLSVISFADAFPKEN